MKTTVPHKVDKTPCDVAGRNSLGSLCGCEEREFAGFASFHQSTPLSIDEQRCQLNGPFQIADLHVSH